MSINYACVGTARFLCRFGTMSSNGLLAAGEDSVELTLGDRSECATFLKECFGTMSANGWFMAEPVLDDRSAPIVDECRLVVLVVKVEQVSLTCDCYER